MSLGFNLSEFALREDGDSESFRLEVLAPTTR